MTFETLRRALLGTTLAALAAVQLTGCVPVVVAGAAAGAALVATDRRSAGAQLDDQTIETKVAAAVTAKYGDTVHVNVTSFNGIVLLTGETPSSMERSDIEQMTRSTERVRSVVNEIVIAQPTPMSSRTNDTYITAKVKTRFVEANRFPANYVKVVTERQVVYLMGIVTHQEGDAAAEIASTTTDVVRVVRVFEYAQ
ncbi:MAG: BON domain-containing protein [Proteobacteria bacterium]|nr:BON domain-containing protein [Pseudomonadota bacterium]